MKQKGRKHKYPFTKMMIESLLALKRVTKKEVSLKYGKSPEYVCTVCSGIRRPSFDFFLWFAKTYGETKEEKDDLFYSLVFAYLADEIGLKRAIRFTKWMERRKMIRPALTDNKE